LGNCTSPLGISLGGTGAITQQGAATAVFPAPTRPGDIAYWTGTAWATVQGNNTGSQVLTESAAGVPSWTPAGFPSAVRAGDIAYWTGTTWTTLPGNNAGTQTLTESPTGVPSWAAYTNGTVTSVVAGTGLSGGTITTSGTVALNVQALTNTLTGDVLITNNTSYFDGPSVSQGTTGTWAATGFITLIDTVAQSNVICKLWDGTTTIAAGRGNIQGTASALTITLTGVIVSPAGNIRISCHDVTAGNGAKMAFSDPDLNAHNSSLTVLRIQ
jgi:hypothetical protein